MASQEPTNPTRPKASFCVVYRTGGTENFQWHRTLPVGTRAAANKQAAEIRAAGRVAMVFNFGLSMIVGLPETFEPWPTPSRPLTREAAADSYNLPREARY